MAEARVLVGRGAAMETMPEAGWWSAVQGHMPGARLRFDALPPLLRSVRRAAVLLLARSGRPVPPGALAAAVGAPLTDVIDALAELERRLFFLVRDEAGEVAWAFPVTAVATPHHLTFPSGERRYGAWAEDSFATPFVQGRLQESPITVRIESTCAECARPVLIDVDEELRWEVAGPGLHPFILEPSVDWSRFTEPSILHAYWSNSLLFCTEEHAREHRRRRAPPGGLYLTLEQSARSSRLAQSALFGFAPSA